MGPRVDQRGAFRRWLVRALEDSLRRLGTDHVDLYQVHRPDPTTAIDETLGRIDAIVPPGTALVDDALPVPPSLTDPALRRRPVPRPHSPS